MNDIPHIPLETGMAAQPASIPRRHDLDALRAIAMLLGIALHGALAYMPIPEGGWPVQDSHQSDGFGLFMAAVHGFRMPLFFLISGFFTAMLWRKRGLASLLENRLKRILIPLVIGMFTFVPAVWIVSIAAGIAGGARSTAGSGDSIWTAAKLGDVEKIPEHLAAGSPVDDRDPSLGATPMSMAAWNGHDAAIELLIQNGADVNARNRDGTTPLHGAAFFGHPGAVQILIDHGADVGAVNNKGQRVVDSLKADWGMTQVVARLLKVEIDRDRTLSGRKEVAQLLQQARPDNDKTVQGAQADQGSAAAVQIESNPKNQALSGLLMLLMLFPFFHHLWFLAFLCWLVLAFAIYAKAAEFLNWRAPRWLFISPLRYLWLLPLTMLPQARMGLLYPNFGPDTSAGLLPIPQVLFYYAVFFFFGAMYFDSHDDEGRVGRGWRLTLPIALFIVFPIGLELTTGGLGWNIAWIDHDYHRPASIALQVVYAWLMTFGLMGLFRSLFSGESKAMRYISDSSYWLYLAHLPLIIVAQAIVRNLEMPALAKFTLICTVTSALLLASYQLFVRYTPIGTLLNGPRKRPQPVVEATLVEASPAQS